jgi:cation diffusion facilitator CzcD-associated flavoprotein CzcO
MRFVSVFSRTELTRPSNWRWPSIDGLESFNGKLLHSARWDQEYDFAGKTVAVIGAGSSAIQIVPKLQPSMSFLAIFW